MKDIYIQAFLSIVNTHSITKTAKQLFLSQSTVSTRIRHLEEELDLKLFTRGQGHRTIELTPQGEAFVPIAERLHGLYYETKQLKQNPHRSLLTIGCIESLNSYTMSALYRELLRKDPLMELSICLNQSRHIYELVANHDLDIGFAAVELRRSGMMITPIFQEGFKLVYYSGAPLDRTAIHPQDLDPKQELFQPWGSAYLQWHEYWFPGAQYYVKFDTAALLPAMMREDGQWSIMPQSIAMQVGQMANFRVLDILKGPSDRTYYLVVNRQPRPGSLRGIELVKRTLKEMFPDITYGMKDQDE